MEKKPKLRIISEINPIYDTKHWRSKCLRTCGYARVSTDSEDQLNSLNNQTGHYEEYIQRNPNWEYVGIFTDEGISGTSTKNRKGFQNMMDACKAGEIDLIVVKDVSRFARNVKECLGAVEELLTLDPPVGIFFENHNLSTLEVGTKMFLTMFAMFAELESELKSQSVEFGITRIYNKHEYPCPSSLLGYVKDEKYKIKIEPEGAKTVRLIYDLFLSGYSLSEVANTLMKLSLPTVKKNLTWTVNSISSLLKNEKFCGDFIMRKNYTESFLTHKTKTNKGQRKLYYETDHHEAIVSREEQARVLLLLAANHASPFFNHEYKIEVIMRGLLSGFIPMNPAFGGYDAGHYLGALVMANLPDMDIEAEVAHITGTKRVRRELFGGKDSAAITMSRQGFAFSAGCFNLMKNVANVEILLHPSERLLAVRKSSNKNSVPWKSGTVSARELSRVLYELMGWNKNWKYRVTANYFEKNGKQVVFFDLNCCEFRIKSEENKSLPTRAIPDKWLCEFGEELPEYILLCRRALAKHLKKWDLNAQPSEVPGFELGFDLPSRAEAEQKISEMRLQHG